MIIDSKMKSEPKYKMARAKVIDQCGTCAETQVDLSYDVFKTMANHDTGVVNMVYVIVRNGEIIDGPHYNASALRSFSSQQGVSREDIIESFKQAARNLDRNGGQGMSSFPWKSGSYDKEKAAPKTTTRKVATTKKTTTRRTTTTRKVLTTTAKPTVKKTAVPKKTSVHPVNSPPIKSVSKKVKPVSPQQPKRPVAKPNTPPPKQEPTNDNEIVELDDFDKKNGGTNAPVTAAVIGASLCGAAGIGLLALKRKSPQKYDDLKQKFPEAFGTVKRSLTRGASTIKRGVSRSVTRRNNVPQNNTPVPAPYTFTLNNEEGLPRVALYDDPYPTKTNGSQHW